MKSETYSVKSDMSGIVKLFVGGDLSEKAYYSSCAERKRIIAKWHEHHGLSTKNFELRILPN